MSPHRVITILLTIFSMLYISVTYLPYSWNLYLLITFTHLVWPPDSGNHQFVLCTYEYVPFFWFYLFIRFDFGIPQICEVIWLLPFSLRHISLSIIHSRSNHVVSNGKISFFPYGWIIFHCTYTYHIFIHSSINGHLGFYHFLAIVNSAAMNKGYIYLFKLVFSFFNINTQMGNCWMVW